jgi:predicted small lipoprotein YifL
MTAARWLLAGGAALLLAGCGQKGALYLPDKNPQVITIPAASPATAPAAPTPATAPPQPTDRNQDDSQSPQ